MAQMVSFDNAPIRITSWGEWIQGEEPLHPRVVELFSQHLVPTMDGRYFIQLGFQRYELIVDDTAYFVVSLDVEKSDDGTLTGIRIKSSDGKTETLRPDSLMQSREDNAFYCRIIRRELGVPCRFPPGIYHTLGLEMEQDAEGVYLEVNGERYRVADYDSSPVPMA
ncbi:MAG: hypothetical protein AAF658_05880 [Myxococcota bacterium]